MNEPMSRSDPAACAQQANSIAALDPVHSVGAQWISSLLWLTTLSLLKFCGGRLLPDIVVVSLRGGQCESGCHCPLPSGLVVCRAGVSLYAQQQQQQ